MIRACTEDRLEYARHFFSSECGCPVSLIGSGPKELAEDCFRDHYQNWWWHGMYSFAPGMLRKFAPTHHEYAIAIAKIKATSARIKCHGIVSKATSKVRAAVNEVAWILGSENDSVDCYEEDYFDEEA